VTRKIYLSDAYASRFDASITRVVAHAGRSAVVLDQTAFYPEGGGQPSDRGVIGGVRVEDVVEADGEVLHVVAGPAALAPGSAVACEVDWGRRFDHMQHHHGQHLLSAVLERLHGAATVSFHLGEETCTIDVDAPPARLGPEALAAAEAAANALVWRDLEVDARERTPDELAALPLRKDAVKGGRVVVVAGAGEIVDASPCGGTHPRRTGEVGAIAVLRAQRWGQGTRLEFACGARVLRLLRTAEERLARASGALRCAPAELPAAAERLAAEGAARRKESERLAEALAGLEAGRLAAAIGAAAPVAARLEGPLATPAGLRAVAQALASRGRIALLGCEDGGRAHLCFARPRGAGPNLGELLRGAAALLGGKGGGSPDLAQGSGPEAGRLGAALDGAAAQVSGG
jgi:alanyl-tRNA synthetase